MLNIDELYSEIHSIEFFGELEVYDLTVPETANFFANGLCVHNSKLMLDNLGIMIDMEKAYEDFAISQGTTVKNLTDEQKKRAFNIATMKEAEAMVQQLGAEELSTTDNLNQLSAAYEDLSASVGRALAPAVNAFASFARAATEVTVADELEKEQRIFNNLVGVMRDTNSSTDQRARALKALKSDYQAYIGNLETEEEILKNIDKIQDDYNTKMRRRIREELLSTGLKDAETELESARQKLFEIEAGFGSARFNIIKDAIEGTTSVGDAFKQVMASLGGFSNVVDFGSLAMELEEFIRLQMMLPTLEKQLADQKAFNDEYRKRNPIVKEGTDAIKENTKAIEENNDTTNADLLTIDEFVEQKAKQLKEYEHEQDLIAQLIEQRPDLAKALNLETEAIKKQTEAEAMNVKMKQKAFEAAGQLADAGANLASSFLGETKEVLRIRQIAAAVDAAAAVNAILADAVSIPNSLIRTALAVSTAVNAAANIKSIQNQISKLQTGGSYITGGEQILQVGEAGAEEVNVTPLDDPTADSSAAGGSTVVINNPMLTESVIEDEIIPMIQRAIDRGAELN